MPELIKSVILLGQAWIYSEQKSPIASLAGRQGWVKILTRRRSVHSNSTGSED